MLAVRKVLSPRGYKGNESCRREGHGCYGASVEMKRGRDGVGGCGDSTHTPVSGSAVVGGTEVPGNGKALRDFTQ